MDKILFYAHDVHKPSGGVAVLYEHVARLRRAGFNASILHTNAGYVPSWINYDVPIEYTTLGLSLDRNDVVVIPEDFSAAVQAFSSIHCRRFIFCQNQFYAAHAIQCIGDWRHYGIEGVIVSTEKARDFLELAGWKSAPLVPCSIDLARFQPSLKKLQIAYMPRKRYLDASIIRFVLPRRFPELASVPWIELDGLHQNEVARILGETAVFLALGEHESLGLPALEAMSAGALVVGYHGDGDLSLAEASSSALWASEPDQAVEMLARVLTWLREGSPEAERQLQVAHRYVMNYSIERRDRALLGCWKQIMDKRPADF